MFLKWGSHCRSPHTVIRFNTKQPEAADCLFMDLSSSMLWAWMNVLSLSTGTFTHASEHTLDAEHFPEDTGHRGSKWRWAVRSMYSMYTILATSSAVVMIVVWNTVKKLGSGNRNFKNIIWILKSKACVQVLQVVLLCRRLPPSCLLILIYRLSKPFHCVSISCYNRDGSTHWSPGPETWYMQVGKHKWHAWPYWHKHLSQWWYSTCAPTHQVPHIR